MNLRPAIIRAYALGIITGAFLTAGLIKATGTANADPDGSAVAFASVYGHIICDTLNTDSTDSTIEALATAMNNEGLTWRQAGQAMVLAVDAYCPQHLPTLRAYANNIRSGAIA